MLHVIVGIRIRLFVVNLIFCSGVRRKEIVLSVEKKNERFETIAFKKSGENR
jgi:hypothetical protein